MLSIVTGYKTRGPRSHPARVAPQWESGNWGFAWIAAVGQVNLAFQDSNVTVRGAPTMTGVDSSLVGNDMAGVFSGSNDAYQFSRGGRAPTANSDITLMAIITPTTTDSTTRRLTGTSTTTSGGMHLARAAAGHLLYMQPSGKTDIIGTNNTLNANETYAVLGTMQGSTGFWGLYSRSLNTGVVAVTSGTSLQTWNAGDGTYNVGGSTAFATNMWTGNIALAAIDWTYWGPGNDKPYRWLSDPWSLFEMRRGRRLFGIPAVGGFTPKFRRSLSAFGTKIGSRQAHAG